MTKEFFDKLSGAELSDDVLDGIAGGFIDVDAAIAESKQVTLLSGECPLTPGHYHGYLINQFGEHIACSCDVHMQNYLSGNFNLDAILKSFPAATDYVDGWVDRTTL